MRSVVFVAVPLLAPSVARAQNAAPLVIESTGREQEVRLAREGLPECVTPCTLRVPPGPVTVWTGGRGLRVTRVPVDVPPEGARVRVRAASRARLVGGIILTAVGGGTLLTFGAYAAAVYGSSARDDYNQFMAGLMGGMALLIGVPTLITGILLVTGAETGVERLAPPAAPRWSLGVAPLPGGATAGATVKF